MKRALKNCSVDAHHEVDNCVSILVISLFNVRKVDANDTPAADSTLVRKLSLTVQQVLPSDAKRSPVARATFHLV